MSETIKRVAAATLEVSKNWSVRDGDLYVCMARAAVEAMQHPASDVSNPAPPCQKVGCQAWKLVEEVKEYEARIKKQAMLIEDAYEQGFTASAPDTERSCASCKYDADKGMPPECRRCGAHEKYGEWVPSVKGTDKETEE